MEFLRTIRKEKQRAPPKEPQTVPTGNPFMEKLLYSSTHTAGLTDAGTLFY